MTEQTGSVEVPAAAEGVYPVLPLRDIVVFPHMIVPLFVGREKSIKALEEVMRADKQVLLVTQQNPSDDEPEPDALYNVATLASVLQLLKLPDGSFRRGATARRSFVTPNARSIARPRAASSSRASARRSKSRRCRAPSSRSSRTTSSSTRR